VEQVRFRRGGDTSLLTVCRALPFYSGRDASFNLRAMRDVLLSYAMFNFDLGYCQVCAQCTCSLHAHLGLSPLHPLGVWRRALWGYCLR